MFRNLVNRVCSDYFMPSRIDEYKAILSLALSLDYSVFSLVDYILLKADNKLPQRFMVLRHDIDTDVSTAKEFFKIESELKVKASYYFRLKTFLDVDFVSLLQNSGMEVGYHFEELATYAKKNRLLSKPAVLQNIQEIKDIFRINFLSVNESFGLSMATVASHGDFANRVLGLPNHILLNDLGLRSELGIINEAYDQDVLDGFDLYISDRPSPVYYSPMSPILALGQYKRICFLTHPKQWRVSWVDTTIENLTRVSEGLRFR